MQTGRLLSLETLPAQKGWAQRGAAVLQLLASAGLTVTPPPPLAEWPKSEESCCPSLPPDKRQGRP